MFNRRSVLSLLAVLTGLITMRGFAPAPVGYSGRYANSGLPALANALERVFSDRASSARILGRKLLEQVPELRDPGRLLASIGNPADLSELERSALLHQLDQMRCNDFAEGMTVTVDNWILSRTEAAVCALVAMS
jgi:hypothetical protein